MGTRSTAGHVLEAFAAAGIDHLFCNLGTDHAPLIEELARRRAAGEPVAEVFLCPHENTAIHMAAGHAWATGRGQAVLVHVDAGTANAVMGLHNLARLRLPVLLLAGRAPFSSHGELTGGRNSYVNFVQEPFDQGALARPYVKWEYTLPAGCVAAEAVLRAQQRMQAAPQGPVYLMAARETLAQMVDGEPTAPVPMPPLRPGGADEDAVQEIARRLMAAERPLIATAYAGRDPQSVALLDELARFAAVRVVEHVPHVLNLPHDSPCHAGFVPGPLVEAADVGLLLDVDVPWIPAQTTPAAGSWWAQVDIDAEKAQFPMWRFPAELRVQASTSVVLAQLLACMRRLADDAFTARAAARLERLARERQARFARAAEAAALPGRDDALNPAHVCAALSRALGPDDVLLNEAVRHAPMVFEQVARTRAGTRVGPAGGGLGYSAGMALGIKLARPASTVVNVVGDGTFYFGNPQSSLAVSARYGLPVFTVVLDNGGWAAVKEATRRVYPNGHAQQAQAWHADLGGATDFAAVARASGAHGEGVHRPDELAPAIAACLAAVRRGQAAVLHARIGSLTEGS